MTRTGDQADIAASDITGTSVGVNGTATVTVLTQGADATNSVVQAETYNNGMATWVVNSENDVDGSGGAAINAAGNVNLDIDDLLSDGNENYALYQQTVNVTYKGYTVSQGYHRLQHNRP